jgi:rare lipoprotein A (peptidoglycan hydrolase)
MRIKRRTIALALVPFFGAPQANAAVASFYHEGQMTASGERFNPHALTAAMWDVPFNTLVRVCRKDICVVVRINDRGPNKRLHRDIDVSLAAAQTLGMVNAGVVPVSLQIIGIVGEVAHEILAHHRAVARHNAYRERMDGRDATGNQRRLPGRAETLQGQERWARSGRRSTRHHRPVYHLSAGPFGGSSHMSAGNKLTNIRNFVGWGTRIRT